MDDQSQTVVGSQEVANNPVPGQPAPPAPEVKKPHNTTLILVFVVIGILLAVGLGYFYMSRELPSKQNVDTKTSVVPSDVPVPTDDLTTDAALEKESEELGDIIEEVDSGLSEVDKGLNDRQGDLSE